MSLKCNPNDTVQLGAVAVDQRRGQRAILVACVFSAATGAAFFAAHQKDPGFSSFGGSFVRVATNLIFISLPFMKTNCQLFLPPLKHKALWLWGVFGALTVTTYFAAVALVGSGQTAFLGASSGVFIAALSPMIAKQRVHSMNWLAITGSILGLYMMCANEKVDGSVLGTALAIASGLFGALAYLMIARTKSAYATSQIMMTWFLSAATAHLLVFCFYKVTWPTSSDVWLLLLLAGLAASLSQHLTTYAFQRAPASQIASLSYLAPVLSLFIDMILFGFTPTPIAGIGASIIFAFGVVVPVLKRV